MLSNSNIFLNTTKTSFQSNITSLFQFEKQFILPCNKSTNPWKLKKQDTFNNKLLKAKIDAEKWRCTQTDPKMIAAKKAAEEEFNNKKNQNL